MSPWYESDVAQIHSYNLEKSAKHYLRKLQEDYNYIEKNTEVGTYQVVSSCFVEYIFVLSKELDLSLEVRYLAIDLFDRFIRNQFLNLFSEIFKTSSKIDCCSELWTKVEQRICNHLELRMLSCLQLATKFVSENMTSSRILTAKDIQDILNEEMPFSLKQIKKSEFRVFKTLNFQINKTNIVTFIDVLLLSIYRHLFQKPEFRFIQHQCYEICDVLYMNHQEIFHRFYHRLTGLWERSHKDRLLYSSVECNGLIKSAAVILTAAQFFNITEEKEGILLLELSKMTNSSVESIQCLSNIIIQVCNLS